MILISKVSQATEYVINICNIIKICPTYTSPNNTKPKLCKLFSSWNCRLNNPECKQIHGYTHITFKTCQVSNFASGYQISLCQVLLLCTCHLPLQSVPINKKVLHDQIFALPSQPSLISSGLDQNTLFSCSVKMFNYTFNLCYILMW